MPKFSRATSALAVAQALTLAGVLAVATPSSSNAQTSGASMTLRTEDSKVGTGASPKTGQICVMHYTGWLYENGVRGKKFDSSVDRGQPFEFIIGRGQVIKGWDVGVAGMKIGGKRKLTIPPDMGYGARGIGSIPANSVLVFEVDLIDIK